MFPRLTVRPDFIQYVFRKHKLLGQNVSHQLQNRRVEQAVVGEPAKPLLVLLRVAAPGVSWGKSLGGVEDVELLDDAVYPAEAEGFFHRVVVDDARFAGGLIGVDQPNLPGGVEVGLQPLTPRFPVRDVEGFADVDEGPPWGWGYGGRGGVFRR